MKMPPYNNVPLNVFDNVILYTDPELEFSRAKDMELVLKKHGKVFRRNPYQMENHLKVGIQGRCYDAAYDIAKKHGLIYCEGLMTFRTAQGVFPMGHGWCCTQDGVVIDPTTWRFQNHDKVTYIGVPLKLEFVEKCRGLYGCIGVLDGNPNGDPSIIHTAAPGEFLEELYVGL